jgi:CheY-like chemotaxis protein
MFEKIAHMLGINKARQGSFQSHCVLIVDDNETDLLLIQRTVEKMGHRALTAKDGKAGLELARGQSPDLILSDCRMPEMDGVEMYRQLKEDQVTQDIPFVFLTGVETSTNMIECFDMGADNYICKPINPQLLTHQIQTIFEEHFAA